MLKTEKMSIRKILMLFFLFLFVLTLLRLGWFFHFTSNDENTVTEGSIDLSQHLLDDETIHLNGEWLFYPDHFLAPNAQENVNEVKSSSILVPTKPENVQKLDERTEPFLRHGTYRLTIHLPENWTEQPLYGIRFNRIKTSAKVYVDGKLIASFNEPTTSMTEQSSIKRGPLTVLFPVSQKTIDLIIHVSNYDDPIGFGLDRHVQFGTESSILKVKNQSILFQILISVLYLLHSLYAFIVYFLNRKLDDHRLFYFGILLTLLAFSVLIDDDIVIQLALPLEWSHRLLYILFISILFVMLKFVQHLYDLQTKLMKPFTILFILMIAAISLVPFNLFEWIAKLSTIYFATILIYLYFHTLRTIKNGYPDALFILLFIASYTSNLAWGIFIQLDIVHIPFYPVDYFLLLLVIAIWMLKQYTHLTAKAKEQTKKLQLADKQKDDFLANTSHELRNPLHSMMNIAESIALDKEEPLTPNQQKKLDLFMKIGQRMTLLIDDLLDVSRLKDGKIRLCLTSVQLKNVFLMVVDMLEYFQKGKDVQIKINISASFPPVLADENRLIQICLNLLLNALKYTNEGTITVNVKEQNEMASIDISDTGIGMDPDFLKRLFIPYVQAEKSEHSSGGLGLGLPITKKLVELHGGTIEVTSTPQVGTTFSFTLPIATEQIADVDAKIAASSIEKDSHPSTPTIVPNLSTIIDRPRILVVDDDTVNRNIIQTMLQSEYDIATAKDGNEAFDRVLSIKYDLIISDVMMPSMSGYELTRKIREHFTLSELPIILLTARNQVQDIATGFLSGANDYVVKPVQALELKSRVKALTDLQQSVREQLRLEAAWRQAQIQPHFLFNTLNTISSLAEINPTGMRQLLQEFGNYLEASFSFHNTEAVVPLEKEIDLTRSYLFIQQQRFGDRLQINWDIEQLPTVQIPPLSIQPIVENAVHHGILPKEQGGTITITIRKKSNWCEIVIQDDGVGIEQQMINQLLDTTKKKTHGVGVANTNWRIRKRYGKGLKIESKLGVGTIVTIQIPLHAS